MCKVYNSMTDIDINYDIILGLYKEEYKKGVIIYWTKKGVNKVKPVHD